MQGTSSSLKANLCNVDPLANDLCPGGWLGVHWKTPDYSGDDPVRNGIKL